MNSLLGYIIKTQIQLMRDTTMNKIIEQLKALKNAPVQIKALKKQPDHGDGFDCYSCNFYKGSKKVGDCAEDTWGGPLRYRFSDPDTEARVRQKSGDDEYSLEVYLCELMYAAETKRSIIRRLKGVHGIVCPNCREDEYRILNSSDRTKVVEFANKNYGEGNYTILNDYL